MANLHLRIPDFDREVAGPLFKAWVPLKGFSFGASQMGSSKPVVGRSPSISDVTLVKEVDTLSSTIFRRTTTGQPVSEVVIFSEGLPPGSPTAIIVFSNALFGDQRFGGGSGGGDNGPVESVTISFQKFEFMSVAQYLARKGVNALRNLANWFQ